MKQLSFNSSTEFVKHKTQTHQSWTTSANKVLVSPNTQIITLDRHRSSRCLSVIFSKPQNWSNLFNIVSATVCRLYSYSLLFTLASFPGSEWHEARAVCGPGVPGPGHRGHQLPPGGHRHEEPRPVQGQHRPVTHSSVSPKSLSNPNPNQCLIQPWLWSWKVKRGTILESSLTQAFKKDICCARAWR